MAKLLTDRTKDEMFDILSQVGSQLGGLKYKGKNFIGCELIIKLINQTPVYELTILQESPNDIIFEAVDSQQLMLRFDGFIQAIK
jgi:hypothetical protein